MRETQALLARLGEVVDRLHEPDFGDRLVDFMHACAPFEDMAIFGYRADRPPSVLVRRYTNAQPAAALNDYLTGAYLLDPFYHAWLSGAAPDIYRLADIAPDRFMRSAYYESFYRKTGIVDELGLNVDLGARRGISVSLCRSRAMGRFRRREIACLRGFEPVLRALMVQHWQGVEWGGVVRGVPALAAVAPTGRIAQALRRSANVSLTPRQAEVVDLILRGASSASIALRLGISPQTVKVHRKNIYAKLNISSQAELFATVIAVLSGREALTTDTGR
jgi:DNA-binding CsgD family transcriptional regulator